MYTLITEDSFDAAHFLSNYEGKCRNIHGHRWRVVAEIYSKELKKDDSTKDMVVDFDTLKAHLKEETEQFDHAFIIEKGSLKEKTYESLCEENFKMVMVDFRTTAENFSKYFYEVLEKKGYDVKQVSVYETPNNCATYTREI